MRDKKVKFGNFTRFSLALNGQFPYINFPQHLAFFHLNVLIKGATVYTNASCCYGSLAARSDRDELGGFKVRDFGPAGPLFPLPQNYLTVVCWTGSESS